VTRAQRGSDCAKCQTKAARNALLRNSQVLLRTCDGAPLWASHVSTACSGAVQPWTR
jgi:hypothetical protein